MPADRPNFADVSSLRSQAIGDPFILGLPPEIVIKRSKWQIASGYKAPTSRGTTLGEFEGPDGRYIFLTNREFDEVDGALNHLPSQAIEARIALGNVPVAVLEIGGGWMAKVALEYGRKYGENVTVTNLDVLLPENTSHFGPVKAVLGCATEMPIESESQDVVYSTFTLTYLSEDDLLAAFLEVARVLKPGGQAFLQITSYVDLLLKNNGLQALSERLGVKVTSDTFENPETGASMIGPLVFTKS
jgi:hypothetical protein